MDENAQLIADAKWEFTELGTVTTSTFCMLTNRGLDAQKIVEQFEEQHGRA